MASAYFGVQWGTIAHESTPNHERRFAWVRCETLVQSENAHSNTLTSLLPKLDVAGSSPVARSEAPSGSSRARSLIETRLLAFMTGAATAVALVPK